MLDVRACSPVAHAGTSNDLLAIPSSEQRRGRRKLGMISIKNRSCQCTQAVLYNPRRPHRSLDGSTPDQAYHGRRNLGRAPLLTRRCCLDNRDQLFQPARIVVSGGGLVGTNADRMAVGLGAEIIIIRETLRPARRFGCFLVRGR